MKAKRTIAGVLALAMLAATAVSVQVAAADGTVTLTASNETVSAAGEAFTVDVSIGDVPSTKINVMDFAVTYDPSVITITSVEIGDAANTNVSGDSTAADAPVFASNILDDEITISWTTGLGSDAWIASDGVVFTISGTVNAGVEAGTVTPIDFAPVTRETYPGSGEMNSTMVVGAIDSTSTSSYTVNATAGSVAVAAATTTTEEPTTTTAAPATTTDAPATTTEEPTTTTTAAPATTTDAPDTETQAPATSTTAAPGGSVCGDVNLDGQVNMSDVIYMNKASIGAVDLAATAYINADVNQDGQRDGTDAMILLRFQIQDVPYLPWTEA